jgi:uncharacterized membrane protein
MYNTELIGYVATVFILASFVISNLKTLRMVNMIGGGLWMVYGYVAGFSAIFVGNLLMVLIHLVKLYHENK